MKDIAKYPLFVAACLALLLSSCTDDFLQPEPQSFFSPENVFTDRAGFEAALVTMRKDLVSEATGQTNPMSNQTAASDAAVPGYGQDWTSDLTPAGGRFVNYINSIYESVRNANTVISRIDDEQVEWESQEVRDEILAEALWHRAYWYYRLVHRHGDVPWIGEEVSGARLDFETHSRWAILEKIQGDLEWANERLPESAVPGAITRGAGNHLLAKVALANLEFDLAVEAATEVINGPYSLMTERFGEDVDDPARNVIWDLHRHNNKNSSENTETILAFVDRYEAPSGARSGGLYTMRDYHPTWWAEWMGNDSEGGRGMIDSGPMYDSLGRGNPNVYFNEWYTYHNWEEQGNTWESTPDLRRADINWVDREEYFYNNPESPDYGEPFDPNNMNRPGQYWATMYPVPYYKTYAPYHPDQAPFYHGANGDWYIFRLAGTYLLRAEAHYWNNNVQAAAEDINVVRERAGAPPISAGDVTIDYIFDERARELLLEEPRQNELNRVSYILAALNEGYSLDNIHENNWFYDRVSALNEYYYRSMDPPMDYEIAPFNFQWPIDDDIISANTQGKINQVPGYSGWMSNEPPLETIDDEHEPHR